MIMNKEKLSNTSIYEQIFYQKISDICSNMETIWEFAQKTLLIV